MSFSSPVPKPKRPPPPPAKTDEDIAMDANQQRRRIRKQSGIASTFLLGSVGAGAANTGSAGATGV